MLQEYHYFEQKITESTHFRDNFCVSQSSFKDLLKLVKGLEEWTASTAAARTHLTDRDGNVSQRARPGVLGKIKGRSTASRVAGDFVATDWDGSSGWKILVDAHELDETGKVPQEMLELLLDQVLDQSGAFFSEDSRIEVTKKLVENSSHSPRAGAGIVGGLFGGAPAYTVESISRWWQGEFDDEDGMQKVSKWKTRLLYDLPTEKLLEWNERGEGEGGNERRRLQRARSGSLGQAVAMAMMESVWYKVWQVRYHNFVLSIHQEMVDMLIGKVRI